MDYSIERIIIRPTSGTNFNEQFTNCLDQIRAYSGGEKRFIIQQSFFLNIPDSKAYLEHLGWIYSTIDLFYKTIPSTSIIAQLPADGSYVSVELIVLTGLKGNIRISYRETGGIHYTVIETGACKELYAGGISVKAPDRPFTEQVQETYHLLKTLLEGEQMGFSDIVRQWNYVEQILSVRDSDGNHIQNYQVLNDVRSAFYSEADFSKGYPAATGIGMNAGGLVLEIYAVKPDGKVNIVPLKNPRQVDAYHYSDVVLVGDAIEKQHPKTTPKFERAKYISLNGLNTIYISGTASIQNEKTVGENDTALQTKITLENMDSLISEQNLVNAGIQQASQSFKYTFIRVYIKEPADTNRVTSICNACFGNIPIHYLIADVCRDNLLLEIEGIAERM
jgi:enamine deaminase RidA (YjgF/YER057c/UK114 family)